MNADAGGETRAPVCVCQLFGHVRKGATAVISSCDLRSRRLRRITQVPSPQRRRAPTDAPAMIPIVARGMDGQVLSATA
jgi:hypothetical protein